MNVSQDPPATSIFDGTAEHSDEPAELLVPGTILGNKYELLEQIGRGGMGVVWKAKDKIADRLVALKFVPNQLKYFELEMERVRESFKKIHALQHQVICPLYGLENDEQVSYYLVMKYLEGETLDRYVRRKDPERKGLPMDMVIPILSRVATALDYAHSQAVLHRDIKPANIFLEKIGGRYHVQLIDFGLADEIRSTLSSRDSTVRLEVSGTRPYMAPEQWRGGRQKAATDQYALAVVAYELLSGYLPFKGSDVQVMQHAVLNIAPEPIPTISDAANDVLQKAMAKDPKERFTNCREFITALNDRNASMIENMSAPSSERSFSLSQLPLFNWWYGMCLAILLLIGAFVLGHIWSNNTPQVTKNDSAPKPTFIAENKSEPPPTSSAFEDIFEAAKKGTVNDVQYFHEVRGISVNVKDDTGRTPLHNAVENSDVDVVKYLVSKGADVHATDDHWGDIPLHYAARNPNVEFVKCLVSHGADVNAKNKNNDATPLHHAASWNSDVDVVKFLVSQGADVNVKNNEGYTPLHDAARFYTDVEVLKSLVAVPNIDINAENNEGETPLDVASSEEKKEILRAAGSRNGGR